MGPFERCQPPLGFCQRGDAGALALVKRKVLGTEACLGDLRSSRVTDQGMEKITEVKIVAPALSWHGLGDGNETSDIVVVALSL
jgi:hypothetical protein